MAVDAFLLPLVGQSAYVRYSKAQYRADANVERQLGVESQNLITDVNQLLSAKSGLFS